MNMGHLLLREAKELILKAVGTYLFYKIEVCAFLIRDINLFI